MSDLVTDLPVDSEAWFARLNGAIDRKRVRKSYTCHMCGSGEVRSPCQACAPPYVLECLRCGIVEDQDNFNCTNQ